MESPPPVLLAQIVCVDHACKSIAVPEISPDSWSIWKPLGRGGLTFQEVGLPPPHEGEVVAIMSPRERSNEF